MFSKRPDGRLVRNLDPIQQIMPYLMKTRTDSMNMYEDVFDCAVMDAYIREKAEEGVKLDYMTIIIAAMVRLIAERPYMNRFIMNGRIYTREKIWVSFVVHPTLRETDPETVLKLCFEGTESIFDIADIVRDAVRRETSQRKGENDLDKLLRLIMKRIPSFLIKFTVDTLMWMDRHNIMPKKIVELSPFHTSLFLTNLKSLGINHIFHHIYNFGTTGLFLAMGKEQARPVVTQEGIVAKKQLEYGLVMDERYCDGLYCARSLRRLRRLMKDLHQLETPLEKRVEDIE